MLRCTLSARLAAEKMVAGWQAQLGTDITVILGGSLVSGLFIWDEDTKLIDVDVRFLVDDDQVLNGQMRERIETCTGLKFRKQLRIGNPADPDDPVSDGVLVEGQFHVAGLDIPLEVEGCIRNRDYQSWAHLYCEVFTQEELAEIRSTKRESQALGHERRVQSLQSLDSATGRSSHS